VKVFPLFGSACKPTFIYLRPLSECSSRIPVAVVIAAVVVVAAAAADGDDDDT